MTLSLFVVYKVINEAINIYSIILVIYALLSWFPNGRESALGQIIRRLVRPYLDIFDRLIPPIAGISFNVIIAIFVLDLIKQGLFTLLSWLA